MTDDEGDNHDNAFRELVAALKEGKIRTVADVAREGAVCCENMRIVPTDAPESRIFRHHMQRIVTTLLPHRSLERNPVLFLLSDEDEPNACVMSAYKPTVMFFSKGLVRQVHNEDELAYALSHELTHLQLAEKLGAGANSKSEEYISDTYPLAMMHRAGYDARAALAFWQRIADDDTNGKADWLTTLQDVHGLNENRAGVVEKGLAALDKHVGGLHHAPRPLPEDLTHAVATARHDSYFDLRCTEAGYDKLSALGKITFLSDAIPQMKAICPLRLKQASRMLKAVKVDPNDPAQINALDGMFDRLLDNPQAHHWLAEATARKRFLPDPTLKPMGRLIPIAKAMRALRDAGTPEEAQRCAHTMLAALDAVHSDALYLQNFKWPGFALPEKADLQKAFRAQKEISTAWEQLATWAEKSKSVELAQALIRMGVPDKQLLAMCPDDFLERLIKGKIRLVTQPYIPQEAYEGLAYGYRGEVMGFSELSAEELQVKNAVELQIKREETSISHSASEIRPISFMRIAPETFAANFEKYFDENLPSLVTPHSREKRITEGQESSPEEEAMFHQNSREMVKMLSELMKRDPVRYHDFVKSFFTGRDDKRDMDALTGKIMAFQDVYARFVASDTYHLFSLEEKGRMLASTESPDNLQAGLQSTLAWWRRTLDYQEPGNAGDLAKVLDAHARFIDVAQEHTAFHLYHNDPVASYEIRRFFHSKLHLGRSFSLSPLLEKHGDAIVAACSEGNSSDMPNYDFKHALIQCVAAQKQWPQDPAALITIYKTLVDESLFPNEEWRAGFVKLIIHGIDAAPSQQVRIDILESLLLGTPLKDLDLRNEALDRWVEANRTLFGKDEGTERYHVQHDAAFRAMVGRVEKNSHFTMRHAMFSKLAEALETQRDWSYLLRDHLVDISRESLAESHAASAKSEFLLHLLSKDETGRRKAIAFLTRSLDKRSIGDFAKTVKLYTDSLKEASLDYDMPISANVSLASCAIEAKRLHENFWNAPAAARVLVLDELLLTGTERSSDRKSGGKHYQRAFDDVVAQVLPENMKYARDARLFLESYANIVPPYQRSLLLSSMMGACQSASSDAPGAGDGVGKRLATILELMGPAERKTGQRVHSHRQVPEDIRSGMERLKSRAAVPDRWDLQARYDAVVPQEYRDTVARVGSLKGAASYFMSLGLEKHDGSSSVMAIQRANAYQQAKEGFRLLHGLVQELRAKDAKLGDAADTLTEMIRQAEDMSALETDADVGARQVGIAQRYYNGLSVTHAGRSFTFETAPWRAYGAEFRDQGEMKGVHFNDLPDVTEAQREYRHAIAKAYVTVELAAILSGGPFDCDRHGAQLRVDTENDHIGLFDHGAMSLEPPTRQEKEQLAQALGRGLTAFQHGEPLASVMHEETERLRRTEGQTPEYLIRVESGLLALSDFMRCLTPADMPDILSGIRKSGKIDPVISGTLMKMVFQGKLDVSGFSVSAHYSEPVLIRRQKTMPTPQPRRFDTRMTGSLPAMLPLDSAPLIEQDESDGWSHLNQKKPPVEYRTLRQQAAMRPDALNR